MAETKSQPPQSRLADRWRCNFNPGSPVVDRNTVRSGSGQCAGGLSLSVYSVPVLHLLGSQVAVSEINRTPIRQRNDARANCGFQAGLSIDARYFHRGTALETIASF